MRRNGRAPPAVEDSEGRRFRRHEGAIPLMLGTRTTFSVLSLLYAHESRLYIPLEAPRSYLRLREPSALGFAQFLLSIGPPPT